MVWIGSGFYTPFVSELLCSTVLVFAFILTIDHWVSIKAFTSNPKTGSYVSVYSFWLDGGVHLWPGIPIPVHFGLVPRHTVNCGFLWTATDGSGLQSRCAFKTKASVGHSYDKQRWNIFRGIRVCFVWRNEAGGGESPQRRWSPAKHHRILAFTPGVYIAFHLLHRLSACAWWKMQLV